MKIAQSCLTLCNPMGSTVHGILQAKILQRVAFPFSKGSFQPSDQTQVSRIAGEFFTSWATREAQLLKNLPAMQETPVGFLGASGSSSGEGKGYPLQYSWASLVAQMLKNQPAMWEDLGSIPGLGYPLQYSGLENSICYIVHGVAKNWTQLSHFHLSIPTCLWVVIMISSLQTSKVCHWFFCSALLTWLPSLSPNSLCNSHAFLWAALCSLVVIIFYYDFKK